MTAQLETAQSQMFAVVDVHTARSFTSRTFFFFSLPFVWQEGFFFPFSCGENSKEMNVDAAFGAKRSFLTCIVPF